MILVYLVVIGIIFNINFGVMDFWMVGYIKNYLIVVWIGFDNVKILIFFLYIKVVQYFYWDVMQYLDVENYVSDWMMLSMVEVV